jgi:hypothetical protein
MRPFVVFALPRSRTAWICYYLAQNKRLVGHDTAIWCKRPGDFFANFSGGMAGTIETGAMIAWRRIFDAMPDARFAVIKRPVEDVKRSLSQFGVYAADGELERKNALLDEISEQPNVLTVPFSGLYAAESRGRLFEHCIGEPYDPIWDATIAHRNIQIDVFERLRALAANQDDIEHLKALVA